MGKVFVLYINENEYVESFDLATREVNVIDDIYNAEHFTTKSEVEFYAEKLGCSYKEIEIEE